MKKQTLNSAEKIADVCSEVIMLLIKGEDTNKINTELEEKYGKETTKNLWETIHAFVKLNKK